MQGSDGAFAGFSSTPLAYRTGTPKTLLVQLERTYCSGPEIWIQKGCGRRYIKKNKLSKGRTVTPDAKLKKVLPAASSAGCAFLSESLNVFTRKS